MITMMITKDDEKGDDKMLKDQSKNNSSESRRIQDSRRKFRVKNQDSRFKISRIKIQGSRSQESRSRFKTQDSRIKRRLNQDKYEKFFSKIE